MVREFPNIPFERYCDDAVVHCGSERQARQVRDAIAARLAQVGLELHPDKTRIVYCPRTPTGVTIMRSRHSRSSATRFVLGWPRTSGGSTL
jgi:hypothetical protein